MLRDAGDESLWGEEGSFSFVAICRELALFLGSPEEGPAGTSEDAAATSLAFYNLLKTKGADISALSQVFCSTTDEKIAKGKYKLQTETRSGYSHPEVGSAEDLWTLMSATVQKLKTPVPLSLRLVTLSENCNLRIGLLGKNLVKLGSDFPPLPEPTRNQMERYAKEGDAIPHSLLCCRFDAVKAGEVSKVGCTNSYGNLAQIVVVEKTYFLSDGLSVTIPTSELEEKFQKV